jgi:flagellar protein FliO/FliZ
MSTMPVRWSFCLLLALATAVMPIAAAEEAARSAAGDLAATPFISDAEWERPRAVPVAQEGPVRAPAGKAMVAMTVSLALVLGLAVGAVFILRRLANRRGGPSAGRHLQLVETVHLGVKRSVSVLRIGDQVVLVGQSEQGMSGLGTLPASVLAAAPAPPAGAPPALEIIAPAPGPSPFAAMLDALTGKRR